MAQSGVILSNRCRVKLNEAQLRGDAVVSVFDTSCAATAKRAAARRLVVGPAGIREAKELAALKRGFDGLLTHVSLRCMTPLR